MRLGIILTEFPKVTETFVLRDLIRFHECGHEIRIFHVGPYRRKEVVHDFARRTLSWVQPLPFLFGRLTLGALLRALTRRPGTVFRLVAELLWGYRYEPMILAKSLFILPKSLAVAENLLEWRADHLHAEFAGHPATCAWIVGRMTGLPYSVSCRAHDIFSTQAMLGPKLLEAAFVRCISQFNKDFLTERIPGLADRPLAVIHSAVDLTKMPVVPPPNPHTFRILFVGALETRKGVDFLLHALAACPHLGDWTCQIIGDGPVHQRMKRLAESLGLSDHVNFLGARSFEEVSRAYRESHLVVVPSTIGRRGRTEGIPNVIMEALAHQRPVIASRVSGIPELIEHGVTGYLVDHGESPGLARAIMQIRQDPETADQMAKRGRELVAKEFDLATNAAAQLSLFAMYRAKRPAGPAP